MLNRRKKWDFKRRAPIGRRLFWLFTAMGLLAAILLSIPGVPKRAQWRLDVTLTALRTLVDPVGFLPKPVRAESADPETLHPAPALPADLPAGAAQLDGQAPPPAVGSSTDMDDGAALGVQPLPGALPADPAPIIPVEPAPHPLPDRVRLEGIGYEEQDWNNCGPATLAPYLAYYGWEGDQFSISDVVKPIRNDRNVNVDELVSFVFADNSGLNAIFRVGGTPEVLRRLLAAGFPVMVEETFFFDEPFWAEDDLWSGHYLLLSGYDNHDNTFTAHDSFTGPDQVIPEARLLKNWQSFNYVYIIVFPIGKEAEVQSILADDWDVDQNRQNALQTAQGETEREPENGFAWFNLGSNLAHFRRYAESAQAYDRAREAGLPMRMLRYQFGPFFAYFNVNRIDDLLSLADYALKVTPNSEEAHLWKGWGLYRQANKLAALEHFQKALELRPGYTDAEYAIRFVSEN